MFYNNKDMRKRNNNCLIKENVIEDNIFDLSYTSVLLFNTMIYMV